MLIKADIEAMEEANHCHQYNLQTIFEWRKRFGEILRATFKTKSC